MKTPDQQYTTGEPLNSTLPKAGTFSAYETQPRVKNDQIRAQQLKQQIEEEMRNNKIFFDELARRTDAVRQEIIRKEQALALAEERIQSQQTDKQILELEQEKMIEILGQIKGSFAQRSQEVMHEYTSKNKFVLQMENEYQRELMNLRQDNTLQATEVNSLWAPKLQAINSRYNIIISKNEEHNQRVLKLKENFIRMRIDHNDNMRFMEQKLYFQEKEKYQRQLDIIEKKVILSQQEMKKEESQRQEIQEDFMRQENKFQQEKEFILGQIHLERESIHKAHEEMSSSNISMESFKNINLVLDGHIEKLRTKIEETNRIFQQTKDQTAEDLTYKRITHENGYNLSKQSQHFLHQRVIELELLVKNTESDNSKMKAEYERLKTILQSRVVNAIGEICKVSALR